MSSHVGALAAAATPIGDKAAAISPDTDKPKSDKGCRIVQSPAFGRNRPCCGEMSHDGARAAHFDAG
jgi:hypothetical protein